ncbi:hypothetical protein CHUAL_001354 [Chamberlinius hualienensis]
MTYSYLIWMSILATCGVASANPPNFAPLPQEMTDYINRVQNSWKAGPNFGINISTRYIERLAGTRHSNNLIPLLTHDKLMMQPGFSIPSSFDAREHWPKCPTIKEVRDQGSCASCWAVGAVTTISDRICIHSQGNVQVHISAEDLLSCCGDCGSGCDGGYPENAWDFYLKNGLVTGGNFNTSEGCRPYSFPECEHRPNQTRPICSTEQTPQCKQYCIPGYKKSYTEDKYYGEKPYAIDSDVSQIQTEIMINGPVETVLLMYEDFLSYKSGVYHYVTGKAVGLHAVKMIGWGNENGEDFWWLINSWNTDWGDNGLFKIRRGVNECRIEETVIAGIPRV